MTTSKLPPNRAARISIARHIIGVKAILTSDDPNAVVFTIEVPTFEIGVALNESVSTQLIAAGFRCVQHGTPIAGHDRPACLCYFVVPVNGD